MSVVLYTNVFAHLVTDPKDDFPFPVDSLKTFQTR